MRILVVVDSVAFGGAERQAVELVRGLRSRHEVHLAGLARIDGGYRPLVQTFGIPYHSFPRRFGMDPVPLAQLAATLLRHRIDVVHTFMNMGSLYGLLAARSVRVPVVASPFRDAHPGSRKSEGIKRFVARHADLCIANSRAGFDARYERWSPSFRVVYNGLDLDRFDGNGEHAETLRREFALDRFDRVIGMVGSMSLHKGHALLLETAKRVLERRPKTGFLVVGDGRTREGMEALARTLGVAENVVFAGYRPDADRIYGVLDVAILLTDTDHADEGTPNAVIEPMAAGLPVVATRCGGTPETLTHGEDGFLVEPKDAEGTAKTLLGLLEDRELAAQIGRAAALAARRRFGLDRYIAECEALYDEALRTRGRRVRK